MRKLCAILLAASAANAHAANIDPDLLAGMKARSIGPAGMSGRVAAVEAVIEQPDIVYVGAATGGIWKSVNGGLSWEPVFDDQRVASIGALAVFQPSPDLVWAGTGEGNPRNSTSVGNGIYRSRDGGDSWEHVGLGQSERVHRILPHPGNPDVVYVAALGRSWGENDERGVYRTDDGGESWRRILYVDERTGAADLAMDPANPRRLLAAMWDYRRWPWFFRSGGAGSGLYLSLDGGDTWKRLTPEDGLPEGELGRVGVAFSHSDPDIAYALVEAKKNVLLRSQDGGATWTDTGAEHQFGNRPFYYSDLRVDPERPNRVYSLWSLISVSEDGGKTWEVLVPFKDVHPDHHAMWINPRDASHILIGNDGGVAESRDRGRTWRFVANLPLAQFYHIRVDMQTPYQVYGGMQDNGSWRGPAAVWENGGIRNHHWYEVGFGDGFDTLPDPGNPMRGYAMSQQGYLQRWDLDTGERRMIRPGAPEGVELRFSWNAGIAIDPFDPATLYFGSQFVHRTPDRGETWEVVSPDLTSNNPEWQKQKESGGLTPDVTGAENFTTIVSIAPSPLEQGVLWVGTDDGRVHVTRDGAGEWRSVEARARGVPANTWVPHIEASHFDPGSAYVVFDDHRRSNWETYVYRVTQYGERWSRVDTTAVDGYALVLAEDPVNPDLLFLGTEFGLYVSLDAGKSWMRWTHGFPTAPTRDLVVHPREHDLVIGTHGRGAYVLDDIRPLRSITPAVMDTPLHLFEIPHAQQYIVRQTGASRFPGHGEFRGENRPYGAIITFSLDVEGVPHPDDDAERARKEAERRAEAARAARADEEEQGKDEEDKVEATVSVFDSAGERINTFKQEVTLGVNRAVWNLRRETFREPEHPYRIWNPFEFGPEVPPGQYRVRVSYEGVQAEASVRVLPDPRFPVSESDRQARWSAELRAGALQEKVADAVEALRAAKSDVEHILEKASRRWNVKELEARGEEPPAEYTTLDEARDALVKEIEAVEKALWQPPDTKGYIADEDALSRIRTARWFLSSSRDAPTAAQLEYLAEAQRTLAAALTGYNALFAGPVAEFRAQAQRAGFGLLDEVARLEVD